MKTTVRHHLRRTHKSGVVPVIRHQRGIRAKDRSEIEALTRKSFYTSGASKTKLMSRKKLQEMKEELGNLTHNDLQSLKNETEREILLSERAIIDGYEREQ